MRDCAFGLEMPIQTHQRGLTITLILDRYRIMGRAGAGGYATVQHAYDTRLKRDVAIKCIKITQSDVARARMSIHDAQMENASIPLLGGLRGRGGAVGGGAGAAGAGVGGVDAYGVYGGAAGASQEGADGQTIGFVPLSSKASISEPAFLSAREKQAARRASRRGLIRTSARPGVDAQRFGIFGADVKAGASGAGAGAGASQAPAQQTVRVGSAGASSADGASFDLSEFAGYSNFKAGPSASPSVGAGGGTVAGAARMGTRRAPSAKEAFENSFSLGEFASGLPGMIAGAGQADINGIGENSIAFAQTADVAAMRASSSDLGAQPAGFDDELADDGNDSQGSAKTLGFGLGVLTDMPSASTRQVAPTGSHPGAAQSMRTAQPVRTEDPLANIDSFPGLEEARTVAHLNDANIVTVYDCVVEGDMAYVIMEYVEGKTLARIMRDLGNDITLDIIANVFNSVSHALEVAHKENVLHLDIKPENVIVNKEGVVKVTDFGLSTLMDATGHGHTGGGTIGYMPLEQMRQQRLDVRTDEWALASLTYEMLVGKNPFKARSLRDAESAIEGAELVIPSLCWDSIDQSVDDIMFDALSPEMDGRYASIKEFADELSPLLGDSRAGKAQLAAAVKGDDGSFGTPVQERDEQPRVYVPFIDKLGVRGSNILMRVFSALGVAMIAVIAMLNFKVPGAASGVVDALADTSVQAGGLSFGLFQVAPPVAWAVLAVFVVLGALLPRFAVLAAYIAFALVLMLNQAWAIGLLLAAAVAAWWWMFGRQSDMMCTLAAMQPLLGSIGFSAVVPVVTGALLDVRDALMTMLMVLVSAIAFASLGSADVGNWDIVGNFIVAMSPEIAGASIMEGFVGALSSAQNWCVMAGWVAGALAYSWLCRKGSHTFDVLGSVACGALIVAGTIVVPLATGQPSLLAPITISSIVVAAVVGVVMALLSVPDRVRMAPGEW